MKTDYRISQSAISGMDDEGIIWAVIEPVWNDLKLDEELDIVLMKTITKGQKAFISMDWFDKEVYNGGIRQFLMNSTGVLAHEVLDGFRIIGAEEHAKILKEILDLFPESKVPKNRIERQKQLEILIDDGKRLNLEIFLDKYSKINNWDSAETEVYPLAPYCITYLNEHKEEFFLD